MKANDLLKYKRDKNVTWEEILNNCLLIGDIRATPIEMVEIEVSTDSWIKALENFNDEVKAKILTKIEKGKYTADYEVINGQETATIYVEDFQIHLE